MDTLKTVLRGLMMIILGFLVTVVLGFCIINVIEFFTPGWSKDLHACLFFGVFADIILLVCYFIGKYSE